jgi:hypothetical protein
VLVLPGESREKIKTAVELEGALAIPVRTGGAGLRIE